MALSPEQIHDIYNLSQVEKWSERKIAKHLGLSRKAVKKYTQRPVLVHSLRKCTSQLQPYYPQIQHWLLQDPLLSGVLILKKLRPLGYSGGHSILHQYLAAIRPQPKPHAFVRIEVPPGMMAQMDWAECGHIPYDGFPRPLYLFAAQESHSRLLYAEFTHSMKLPTLCRCHWHAFHAWGGVTREVLFDNMKTVVARRQGRIIAFHLPFLDFARQMGFLPKACQVAAPWQKGKIERVIGYLQQNFLPGRDPFTCLANANQDLRNWLQDTANERIHRETRQKPAERFCPQSLLPLPPAAPDYRDIANPRVGKDLRLHFDGNRYCLPARYVGSRLLVKADSYAVSIYHKDKEIVSYPRIWSRHVTLGAERYEKELLATRPRAIFSSPTIRLIQSLGPSTEPYLQALADHGFVLDRQISQLLELVRRYDPEPVRLALQKALSAQAWGVDYITNILLQQAHPCSDQPPVILQNKQLALLIPDPISLLEYDAFLLKETEPRS